MPDPAVPYTLSYPEIKKILEKRLEEADYRYEMNFLDSNTLKTTLHGITDTTTFRSLAISGARIQFREIYDVARINDMFRLLVNEQLKKDSASKKNVPAPPENRDTTTRNGLAENLPSSYTEEEKTGSFSLVEFSSPYTQEGGNTIFPAEIGYVKLKDTAEVMRLLRSPGIAAAAPKDLQLYFGQPDNYRSRDDKEMSVALYCIRTYNRPPVLENNDILDANVSYSPEGAIMINLEFRKSGIRKWADMTQKNVGRPIAMIVDDIVISAPNVNEPILDGSSNITGSYTHEEAMNLSDALKSKKLPAKTHITSVDIKQENATAKLIKKLLVTFATFLIAGTIAFFLFKTLKPS